VIVQSCLHNLAKIVVERQSQPTSSSLLALEPRQIARKPRGRTVLPAVAYYAKDLRAALNRQTYPSNMLVMASNRAPSEVTRSVCLQLPTFHCPRLSAHLSPVFSPAAFHIRSRRMLNRSSDDLICRSHVGRYRPFSSQPPSLSCLIDIGGHSLPILCCYIQWISALRSQIRAADDAVDVHLVVLQAD
jgi:hypothetical protein